MKTMLHFFNPLHPQLPPPRAAKALFYNRAGQLVWECTIQPRYELHNGSKAMKKGAYRGVLYDTEGNELDALTYGL
jgi:hypothetical protein